jgi:hypothetical protein
VADRASFVSPDRRGVDHQDRSRGVVNRYEGRQGPPSKLPGLQRVEESLEESVWVPFVSVVVDGQSSR